MARRPQSKKSIPLSDVRRRQNPDHVASLPQPNDSQSSAPTTLAEPTSAPVPYPTQPTPRANIASASPPSASSNVSRQSHTSDPQIHTSIQSRIKVLINVGILIFAVLGFVVTVLGFVVAVKDSQDQADFRQQELDLLRQNLDLLQGTAPAGENRVTRPNHLVVRSESPQGSSTLRYLLERCLGSPADWQNDETLFRRLGILAEMVIISLLFSRMTERQFRQWLLYGYLAPVARFLGIEEEKPKPDTIGWPPESPSAIFVGTEKQGGIWDFVRIDVANLSSGDRVLWDIARYFRIWTLYETWCRLHDLRLVKVRTMMALHHPQAIL